MPEYVLRLLQSKKDYEEEGDRLQQALLCYYDLFKREGIAVYSLQWGNETLLTLSVRPEGDCRHVVGLHNRAPTAEELDLLVPLLRERGITLAYDAKSAY